MNTPKVGRPSLYSDEYPEQLYEHMKQGYSFQAFAGRIGVHRDTLYEWVKVHPDFSDAKKKGTAASLFFYEQIGVEGMMGQIDKFNTAAWIFKMKNRFGWQDKVEKEIVVPEGVKFEIVQYEDKKD